MGQDSHVCDQRYSWFGAQLVILFSLAVDDLYLSSCCDQRVFDGLQALKGS